MKTKEEKLKLIEISKRVYSVPTPKRMISMGYTDAKIVIAFTRGEYQYIPRKLTFNKDIGFTSEELRAIADKLDELNSEIKHDD